MGDGGSGIDLSHEHGPVLSGSFGRGAWTIGRTGLYKPWSSAVSGRTGLGRPTTDYSEGTPGVVAAGPRIDGMGAPASWRVCAKNDAYRWHVVARIDVSTITCLEVSGLPTTAVGRNF